MTNGPPLSVGLTLPTAFPKSVPICPQSLCLTAQWAERSGFDALWVGDHLFHPWHYLEALVSLSFVAASTKTIDIGTSVLLLPMRQLAVAATQISTLSLLSGGRFRLGLGVGGEWPDEWIAAGVPLKERGARLDEMVPLLRRLLVGETVNFDGRFHVLPDVAISPAPPPVPFYFAGRVHAAFERAAKYGDGWIGFMLTLNGFKRDRSHLMEARERAGMSDKPFRYGMSLMYAFDTDDTDADLRAAQAFSRDFSAQQQLTPLEKLRRFIVAGTPERVREQMQAYVDAGCDTFVVGPVARGASYQEQLDVFAAEVLPKLKSG